MPSAILPLAELYFTSLNSPLFLPSFPSIFSLPSPFSHLQVLLSTTITTLLKSACPLLLPSLSFCASVWQLRVISRFLSTTFCLLSMTPLNPNPPLRISGHLSHFPLSSRFSLDLSLSFYYVAFILSSSLSYIIQASASHSEIKACACVPSNSKLPTYWKDRQGFVHML